MSPTVPQFILFAHARSGGSNLLKALQLHPLLRIAEEPFHEKYHVWHPDDRWGAGPSDRLSRGGGSEADVCGSSCTAAGGGVADAPGVETPRTHPGVCRPTPGNGDQATRSTPDVCGGRVSADCAVWPVCGGPVEYLFREAVGGASDRPHTGITPAPTWRGLPAIDKLGQWPAIVEE
jgi:hypothetical protein